MFSTSPEKKSILAIHALIVQSAETIIPAFNYISDRPNTVFQKLAKSMYRKLLSGVLHIISFLQLVDSFMQNTFTISIPGRNITIFETVQYKFKSFNSA